MSFNNILIENVKTKWEEDLGTNISGVTWDKALSRVNGTSCARLNLIQFEVLHRIHYSKFKLAKIYPTVV